MKLIDLLVQELPKRGGWPNDAKQAWQSSSDGEVYFDGFNDERVRYRPELIYLPVSDNPYDRIQVYQYEAALAASQQPVWSGDGLPPVGCECEVIPHNNRWGFLGAGAHVGKVIAYDGEDFWFKVDNGGKVVSRTDKVDFIPIRTEADRKREETVNYINMNVDDMNESLAGNIYDLIASGDVPNLKLQ